MGNVSAIQFFDYHWIEKQEEYEAFGVTRRKRVCGAMMYIVNKRRIGNGMWIVRTDSGEVVTQYEKPKESSAE